MAVQMRTRGTYVPFFITVSILYNYTVPSPLMLLQLSNIGIMSLIVSLHVQLTAAATYELKQQQEYLQPNTVYAIMDDILYSRIRVTYVLRPCAVEFALRNVHDIFKVKWPLVVFNISVACYNFKTTV